MRSTPIVLRRPVLLDSNVLIGAVDPREQARARLASEVVRAVMIAGMAVVSPQVIVEYFDVTTRPRGLLPPIFTKDEATAAVEAILASCRCVDLTPVTAIEAVRAAARYQMRIFDAHIWAAARLNGIDTILSEDAQSRPTIEGVRYVNPFAEDFALAQIGL